MSDLRYRLVGPKVQVIKIEKGLEGLKMHLKMGPVKMIWDIPVPDADVREGDILTLYTEVLMKARESTQ